MLVEEFKRCIISDVKSFLDEKEVETLEKAARLADDHTLTHKVCFVNKANPRKPFYPPAGHKPSPSLQSGNFSQNTPKPKPPGKNKDQNPLSKSRKETPQKLTQLSSRSHPRHLVGKRTAQQDITIDTTSDSQVNSNFPNRWSPASLTFNNYFYLFLYLYMT